MSVLPLSHNAAEAPEGTVSYGTPQPRPDADTGRLDAAVKAAVDKHYPDDDAQPKSERKDLDSIISENLDRHEAAIADRESFAASRESRDELQERYAGQGAELSK